MNPALLSFSTKLDQEYEALKGFTAEEYAKAPLGVTPPSAPQQQAPQFPTAQQPFPSQVGGVQVAPELLTGPSQPPAPVPGALPQGTLPHGQNQTRTPGNSGIIFDVLTKEGKLPPHIAYGFLGNDQQESGFNPNSWNAKEGAFGIGQWRGERFENLKKFAADTGQDYHDVATQARFKLWELNNTERGARDKIMAARDPAEAARLIDQYYERSAGTEREQRAKYAMAFAGGEYTGDGGNIRISTKGGNNEGGASERPASRFDRFLERIGMGPVSDPDPTDDETPVTGRQRAANILEVLSSGLSSMSTGKPIDLSDILSGQNARREAALRRVDERKRRREETEGIQSAQVAFADMYPEYADLAMSSPQGLEAAMQVVQREDTQEFAAGQQAGQQDFQKEVLGISQGHQLTMQSLGFDFEAGQSNIQREFLKGENVADRQSRVDMAEQLEAANTARETRAWDREDLKEADQRTRDAIDRGAFIETVANPQLKEVMSNSVAGFNYGLDILAKDADDAAEIERLKIASDLQTAGAIEVETAKRGLDEAALQRQKDAAIELYGEQIPRIGEIFDANGMAGVNAEVATQKAASARTETVADLLGLGEALGADGEGLYYLKIGSAMAADPNLEFKDAAKAITDASPERMREFESMMRMTPEGRAEYIKFLSDTRSRTQINLGNTADTMAIEHDWNQLGLDREHLEEQRQGYNAFRALQNLQEVYGDGPIPSGVIEKALFPYNQFMSSIGLADEDTIRDVGFQEAMQSVTFGMVPSFREPGATSNFELEQYLKAAPGLANTPQGNQLKSQMATKKFEISEQRILAKEAYMRENDSLGVSKDGKYKNFEEHFTALQESGDIPQTFYVVDDDDITLAVEKGFLKKGDTYLDKVVTTDAEGNKHTEFKLNVVGDALLGLVK